MPRKPKKRKGRSAELLPADRRALRTQLQLSRGQMMSNGSVDATAEPLASTSSSSTSGAPRPDAAKEAAASAKADTMPQGVEDKVKHYYEVELDFGWVPMDDETASAIRRAEAEGKTSVDFEARGNPYTIDLSFMVQVNRDTGMTRDIRRRDGEPPAAEERKGKGKGKGEHPFFASFGAGLFGGKGGKGLGALFHGKGFFGTSDEDDDDDDEDSASDTYEDGPEFEVELDDGWAMLDAAIAPRFARAEAEGTDSFEYRRQGNCYIVDLKAMVQTNKSTNKRRRIRKVAEQEEQSSNLDALPGLRELHDLLHQPPPPPPKPAKEMPNLSADMIKETVLGYVPEANEWVAPRSGGTLAIEFLVRSYTDGLPAFPPAVSSHLAEGVRIIVGALREPAEAGVTKTRAKFIAQQFAETFTNCQAVQARVIDALQAEIRGVASHSLPAQLRALVEEQREMALDRTVCHFHPHATTTDDGTPTEQLPHLSNRYRRILGDQMGLGGPRMEAAKNDRNAQMRLPVPKKRALQKFWSEFTAHEVVKTVVADVNQTERDVQRRIDLTLLMKWAGQNESVMHGIFYDETKPELYGELKPSEEQTAGRQPVLHDALAVQVILGVLRDAGSSEATEKRDAAQ